MLSPGQQLRVLREQRGFTMREVEAASMEISKQFKNDDFIVGLSTLSDIEAKGVCPSIFRLQSLAIIYDTHYTELLEYYGVDMEQVWSISGCAVSPKTHQIDTKLRRKKVRIPSLPPSMDFTKTSPLTELISAWGLVPFYLLEHLDNPNFLYAYIGTQDFSMYPILPPGSFIQVDQTRTAVAEGMWRSELERPIYFVETREGYACCWCSLRNHTLTLQPHPLSPAIGRTLKYPQEAEIVGQVVGVAMRLVDWNAVPVKAPKSSQLLS